MKACLNKITFFNILILQALFLSVFGSNDESKIEYAVRELNRLVAENLENERNGREHLNNYVFFIDEPAPSGYIKEYQIPSGYRFIQSAVINDLNEQLRVYASGEARRALYFGIDGSNIKVLHKLKSPTDTELAEKKNKEDLNKKIAEARERIRSNTIEIFEQSKVPEYGALVTVTPIDFYVITHSLENGKVTSRVEDDEARRWFYSYGVLGAFWDEETISFLRGAAKQEGILRTFNDNPDAAFRKYVHLWQEVLLEDMLAKQTRPHQFKGFAASYFEKNNSEDLPEEEQQYLFKLCEAFNSMGINLLRAYEAEIRQEDLNKIGRALVSGKYGGTKNRSFKELYEEYSGKYNSYLKGIEKLDIEVDAERIIATISRFNEAELQQLPILARLQALKYVNTIELEGGLFFDNSEEYVLALLRTTPEKEIARLLDFLEREKVSRKGKEVSLIYALLRSYDDGLIASSNYRKLMDVIKDLMLSAPEVFQKYVSFDDQSLDRKIFYWRSVSMLQTYCNTHNQGDFKYKFKQLKNGKIEVEPQFLSIKERKTSTSFTPQGHPIQYGYWSCDWQPQPTYELNPFDIVIFVDVNNSSLVEGLNHNLSDYAVPALFLEYVADKDFDELVLEGVILGVDVVTTVVSGGMLTAAIRSGRWALAVWEAAEIAGALGNVYAQSFGDPQLDNVMTAYNGIMLTIGIKNMVRGAVFSASKIKRSGTGEYISEQLRRDFVNAVEEAGSKIDKLPEAEKIKGLARYFGGVSKGAGKLDDALLDAAKLFDDNVLDVASVGFQNWKTFQNRVAEQLKNMYPGKKIGNQITLDVTYIENGITKTKTIIPDNLIQIETNGVKKYKVIDAKTSNSDLVNKSDLTSTCTQNQQTVYPLIDGSSNSAVITKVEMRGQQAQNAFGENVVFDMNGRATIQLETGVEFWVNSSTTDFTQYAIRLRIK